MPEVIVYTDGACLGNPGPGGWAARLQYGDAVRELSGSERETTNQRMELTAVIEGLRALKRPCRVQVYSDSAYVVNAFRHRWIDRWIRNGWRTRANTPVENQDLWQELLRLMGDHRVTFHKVKGHADDAANNRVDELARQAARQARDEDRGGRGGE